MKDCSTDIPVKEIEILLQQNVGNLRQFVNDQELEIENKRYLFDQDEFINHEVENEIRPMALKKILDPMERIECMPRHREIGGLGKGLDPLASTPEGCSEPTPSSSMQRVVGLPQDLHNNRNMNGLDSMPNSHKIETLIESSSCKPISRSPESLPKQPSPDISRPTAEHSFEDSIVNGSRIERRELDMPNGRIENNNSDFDDDADLHKEDHLMNSLTDTSDYLEIVASSRPMPTNHYNPLDIKNSNMSCKFQHGTTVNHSRNFSSNNHDHRSRPQYTIAYATTHKNSYSRQNFTRASQQNSRQVSTRASTSSPHDEYLDHESLFLYNPETMQYYDRRSHFYEMWSHQNSRPPELPPGLPDQNSGPHGSSQGGSQYSAKSYTFQSKKFIFEGGELGLVQSLCLLPANAIIVACSDMIVALNYDTWELIWTQPYNGAWSVTYCSDKDVVWASSRDDRCPLTCWSTDGRKLKSVILTESVSRCLQNIHVNVNSHAKLVATYQNSTGFLGVHVFSSNGKLDHTLRLQNGSPAALFILPPRDNFVIATYRSGVANLWCFCRATGNMLWVLPLTMSIGQGRHCRPIDICQDPLTKKLLIADRNQDAIWLVDISGPNPIIDDPQNPVLDYSDKIEAPTALSCNEKALLVGLDDGQLLVFKRMPDGRR